MLHVKARTLWLGLAVVCTGTWAQAACTMDNDCTGDLVCQDGQCVAPSPPATAAPPQAPPPARASATPAEAPSPEPAPLAARPSGDAAEAQLPRHSTAMMVGGSLMVPVGALVLAIAVLTSGPHDCQTDEFGRVTPAERDRCDDKTRTYVLGIGGALLVGGGIPLIVIGSKRVPAAPATTAAIVPWLSPDAAGVRVQLSL